MDTQSEKPLLSEDQQALTPEQAAKPVADSIEVLANLLMDAHKEGGDEAVAETYEQIGDLLLETLNSILENQQQTAH